MQPQPHQYIDRESGEIRTESLYGDRFVRLLYHGVRENAPAMFRLLTGARASSLLGFLNFDAPFGGRITGNQGFLAACGVDLDECFDPPHYFTTPRKVFERQIRYGIRRPLPDRNDAVASPADARVIIGSFRETSLLFLKEKFFSYEELLGHDRPHWLAAFRDGDFAVLRLTPDKYHYNHTPVAGRVTDIYEIPGTYHSCNPGAIVQVVTPYSKNKRVITIIDTDVAGGTGVGMVAMIEVIALMIGDIVQCYSREGYQAPQPVVPGMFVVRGAPKSLYRPGSSTDVLIFQAGRIRFADDILANLHNRQATSRFSDGFGQPLVETDIKVRSLLAVPEKG